MIGHVIEQRNYENFIHAKSKGKEIVYAAVEKDENSRKEGGYALRIRATRPVQCLKDGRSCNTEGRAIFYGH